MRFTLALAVGATLALMPGIAYADSIDGTWCSTDTRSLSIDGPKIITPGRHQILGNYGRHDFTYTVPPGEDGAGNPVAMLLVNEQTVQIRFGAGAIETWRRCQVIS